MKCSRYEIVKIQTNNTMLIWESVHGIVNKQVADIMDTLMLEWMVELTDCLKMWIDKGENITVGELILARTNLGSLVEAWLRFYYYVFYIDYLKQPKIDKKNKIINLKDMKFVHLTDFSIGKLWDDKNNSEYIWVNKIRDMRNSIHILQYKEIGGWIEFADDLEKYYDYVDNILNHLPPIEDYIREYPIGYINESYFN